MPVADPTRSDALQIENADAPNTGPRLIEASLLDGSLRFTDPRIPTGVNLAELAGLQRAQNVVVVSQTGVAASKDEDGNPITTIQGGIDAVPDGADVDNPWVVLVAPGLYFEDIIWDKDGVEVRGLSRSGVRIRNLTAQSTIRVVRGVFTVPQIGTLSNCTVEQAGTNSCVQFSSAQFATGSLTFAGIPLPGDSFQVDTVTLTAVDAGTVPGAFEFELGADVMATAENAADAIRDPINGLNNIVVPFVNGSIVTLRALNPGVAGNALTLNTSVPLVIVISGPTFTNGMDTMANSPVASNNFVIQDCNLVPDSAPGNQVQAASINNVELRNCSFEGSPVGTSVSFADCARLRMTSVPNAQAVQFVVDSGSAVLPSNPPEGVFLDNVVGADLQVQLTGVGALTGRTSNFTLAGFSGTQAVGFEGSTFDTMNLSDTTALTLDRSTRKSLSSAGTPTLSESLFQGVASFAAVDFVAVTFDAPQPNLNYQVLLESALEPTAVTDIPFVRNKTLAGFEIAFPAATPQSTTVSYVVQRNALL